jgi:hypothetical protein
MTHVRYTPVEVEHLIELAGDFPLGLLARKHNAWARQLGLPERSERALHQFLKKRGVAVEPIGDCVRSGTILSALGISQGTIEHWVNKGWIVPVQVRSVPTRPVPVERRGPVRRAFRRKDLRRMAKKHPEAFAGASHSGLYCLLEDEALCDRVLAIFPKRTGCLNKRRPVMCVETRERYQSIRAASRATGIWTSLIREAVVKGRRARGTRWVDASTLLPLER